MEDQSTKYTIDLMVAGCEGSAYLIGYVLVFLAADSQVNLLGLASLKS